MNTFTAHTPCSITRSDQRQADELRPIRLTRGYSAYAEGSVLVEYGNTKVLCTASVVKGVPDFLRDSGQGWLTAEYSMLPRATQTRMRREVTQGKATGRTQEIQRLIGRSLRTAFNLNALGPYTLYMDCDVLQADGGTRTASITGAFVAAYEACMTLPLVDDLVRHWIAAVSVGVVKGQPLLDLNYEEDSQCDTDMNIVMSSDGHLIEIQGTAERDPFSRTQLSDMLDFAQAGIAQLIKAQKAALGL